MCRSEPISNEIRRARYRLLGHCLRLDPQTPAQQAMNYYFENIIRLKQFNGTARNTIAELISKEIKLAAQQDQHCNMIIKKFETRADLDWLRKIANHKLLYKIYCQLICKTIQAPSPRLQNQQLEAQES